MRKTAILLALACAFARADYGPGTTDSDLLRSGTPVVTNAWLAVSNETAQLVASSSVDASKITDGTNMIDAARNVYLVRDNCWIRGDGLVLVPSSESSDTWVSITNTIYGYVSLYFDGSMWQELETAIPTILYRDGATLTNDSGFVVYRMGEYKSIVGKLALTNDIPTVTEPDFTTNNTQLVATIEAKAPAPGNYAAVSNAAMNARSGMDLGIRGAPQGDGSWFTVNGERIDYDSNLGGWGNDVELLISKRDHDYLFEFELGDFPFSLTADFFSTNVCYVDIDQHTNTFVIIGYTNTIAQVSQIPDVPSASDATPLMDGTASAGMTNAWARGDHVHPSDISKQDTLPYPTNAIPFAAITGAPTPPSVFYDSAGGEASISGATLTYQAASNSVGSVALLAGTNVLHITAPSAIPNRVRDFGLTVTTEDAATITLDTSVSWRFDAASTNLSAGSWNRVYCTESPSGVFSLQLWTPDSAQEATP